MGEPASMPFTGERYVPEIHGPIELEHRHRYYLARHFVAGKRILDIACGEGYGSAILAAHADQVVGVDIDPPTISHAKAKYAQSNLSFMVGQCEEIPLPDRSVDIVVSFETIEHTREHRRVLAEMRRVLTPDGLLIMSSPNTLVYSATSDARNPFHLKEVDLTEFTRNLQQSFSYVRFVGQRISYGSLMLPLEREAMADYLNVNGAAIFGEKGPQHWCRYYVALASNRPLPELRGGFLGFAANDEYQDGLIPALQNQLVHVGKQINSLQLQHDVHIKARTDLQAKLGDAQQELATLRLQHDAHIKARTDLQAKLGDAQQELATLQRQYANLEKTLASSRTAQTTVCEELKALRAGRWWRLHNLITNEPWTLGKAKRLARLGLSLARDRFRYRGAAKRPVQPAKSLPPGAEAFDANFYLKAYPDVAAAGVDPYEHYCQQGHAEGRLGHAPIMADFDAAFYLKTYPDVVASGMDPGEHFRQYGQAEGRPAHPPRISDFDAAFYLKTYPDVAASGMDPGEHFRQYGQAEGRLAHPPQISDFDAAFYLKTYPDVAASGMDPGEHFRQYGQAEGRLAHPPRISDFDAAFYLKTYPDVAAGGMDPGEHFRQYGQAEGRLGRLLPLPGLDSDWNLDPQRDTVMVVCHEGTRTGAPILGFNLVQLLLRQYNVLALFLGPGPVLEACRELGAVVLGPIPSRSPILMDQAISSILGKASVRFAIVNSVESRLVLEPLSIGRIATVSLIHEFAAYSRPYGAIAETTYWSGATIFSSTLTRDNAVAVHKELAAFKFPVLPQGRCILPKGRTRGQATAAECSALPRTAAWPREGFVILGLGSVILRKGVDLFIDCAARIRRNSPDMPIHFVWVGKGYDPANDAGYSVYLADQIERAQLAQRIQFIDELPDLQDVYAAADLLLLSSRLDPLPNVAIDAMSEGLPVLCFDQATGIADVLIEHGLAEYCVAPYLDTARMTEQLLALAHSPALHQDVAARVKNLAAQCFQMPRYVEQVVAIAEQQRAAIPQPLADIATIRDSGALLPDFALSPRHIIAGCDDAARLYVHSWAAGAHPRKPFPGFHPAIYQNRHGLECPNANPFADYLRQGRPEGPWLLPVITPGSPAKAVHGQRIALHVHAFYPEMISPILDALGHNQTSVDLLISVANERDRHHVIALTRDYQQGQVDLRTVPNRGRDLGPFCTAFAETIRRDYDIVGHVHTKKSPQHDTEMVDQWVRFLSANLLGLDVPMADRILVAMVADPRIGLVFPDDPHVLSWEKNRHAATALAQRLALPSLPDEITFPVGSMFWARVPALEPLLALRLCWEDYPAEPVPNDGTILHAIERLLPLIATSTGHTIAVTHVPGVNR